MSEIDQRVAALRSAGGEFSATFDRLLRSRQIAKLDPQVNIAVQRLLGQGASLKSAIRSTTQVIEAGKRWTERTFQTSALDTIPFAPKIIATTAASSTAAIGHYLDAAKPVLAQLDTLQQRYDSMSNEERSGLAAIDTAPLPKPNTRNALILLAILGGVIWWYAEE